jgi:hypothetical protein
MPDRDHLTNATRAQVQAWVEQETSTWRSTEFVSLNFKLTNRIEAGTFVRLNEQIARKEIEKFGKRLDRAVHGHLVQRFNRRVPRFPFLEHGADRGWHAHILFEKPEGMMDVRFHSIVRDAWSESPWSTTFHSRQADSHGPEYLAKVRSKSMFEIWTDTLVVEAIVFRTK